ncbi:MULTISPECIES: DUF924 family protein [Corallincola]|uniref:DUF924 domain-containing protein n=2 Tax=Corallincola TaxID=1775176 RepID=A0A368NLQ2_9GAMM|nr:MULTISPECIES: DUF924 family protein [Corallincola]RCU50359.1 DUF924 domain-containing protein [Corallincola holothuriorum]TAA48629.1 DUF924 domain-containing protein [Corallincola spongiicola]
MARDEFNAVTDFWFNECEPIQWWQKSESFDRIVEQRFLPLLELAIEKQLDHWRSDPQGRLAEIILLDQFSRNIWRNTAQAFAQDPQALALAEQAVHCGADKTLPINQRAFIYMPFMHSESISAHEKAVVLFSQPGLERNLHSELQHKAIIERFGRYPHRNATLGRNSSQEELEFLTLPGSSF